VMEQARPGFAAALNTGIAAASSPRVGFLLSDDWLEPGAVEQCLPQGADIVSTGHRKWYADGVTSFERRAPSMEAYEALPDRERKAGYLKHFFLFRKAALEAAGGLDETLGDSPGIDDYDLIWTLLERGATVAVIEESLYNYRDHEGSRLTLGEPAAMRATMRRILAKHGVTGPEQERLLGEKARWFGAPIHSVIRGRRE
ncbi:MAG: glycosyltransferase family 2 protein, partial [Bryobacteraceae bacterium]